MEEFRKFLRDVGSGRVPLTPMPVVAIDENCHGYSEERGEVSQIAARYDYRGKLVCAVPDPHIERWYVADPEGLRRVAEAKMRSGLPPYKCERDLYKHILRQVFADGGIVPSLGRVEYGDDIVREMDLYTARQSDRALKHFVDDLREASSALR